METMTIIWDKDILADIREIDRPRVRVQYECTLIDEDSRETSAVRTTTGIISIDGNNPWVCISAGGRQIACRFSWGLVLDVLNNKFAPHIYFSNAAVVKENGSRIEYLR